MRYGADELVAVLVRPGQGSSEAVEPVVSLGVVVGVEVRVRLSCQSQNHNEGEPGVFEDSRGKPGRSRETTVTTAEGVTVQHKERARWWFVCQPWGCSGRSDCR